MVQNVSIGEFLMLFDKDKLSRSDTVELDELVVRLVLQLRLVLVDWVVCCLIMWLSKSNLFANALVQCSHTRFSVELFVLFLVSYLWFCGVADSFGSISSDAVAVVAAVVCLLVVFVRLVSSGFNSSLFFWFSCLCWSNNVLLSSFSWFDILIGLFCLRRFDWLFNKDDEHRADLTFEDEQVENDLDEPASPSSSLTLSRSSSS